MVEDPNVKGALGDRRLARSLPDAGFYWFRQLTYRCQWYGSDLVAANRWLPRSKTCSGCGQVKPELSLWEPTYRCQRCGVALDRDVNAAINLAGWAHPAVTAGGSGRPAPR